MRKPHVEFIIIFEIDGDGSIEMHFTAVYADIVQHAVDNADFGTFNPAEILISLLTA